MNHRDLDNYITGHFGEDQFTSDEDDEEKCIRVNEEMINKLNQTEEADEAELKRINDEAVATIIRVEEEAENG